MCLSRNLLPAIALYLTQQNWKYLHVRLNRQHAEFHVSNFLESSDPWKKTSTFFSPLRFEIQRNSDHETPKIKLYSVRALKCYLN